MRREPTFHYVFLCSCVLPRIALSVSGLFRRVGRSRDGSDAGAGMPDPVACPLFHESERSPTQPPYISRYIQKYISITKTMPTKLAYNYMYLYSGVSLRLLSSLRYIQTSRHCLLFFGGFGGGVGGEYIRTRRSTFSFVAPLLTFPPLPPLAI